MIAVRLIVLILCAAVALAAATPGGPGGTHHIGDHVETLRGELQPLTFEAEQEHSAAAEAYFDYYGLHIEGVRHVFGTFRGGGETLAAHFFIPENAAGTVLLLHGYYDHAGNLKHLISHLVAHSLAVAVYDQAGHGLSSGEPASIDDFARYVSGFREFRSIAAGHSPAPLHLVAHSMGCAVATDYLLTAEEPGIRNVVFLAPLFHSAWFRLSQFAQGLAEPVVTSVPRVFRKNSADKEFLAFMKNDPLQTRRVPMGWVKALGEWNERASAYVASDRRVVVMQGTGDRTVDWKYNLRFVKGKFPNVKTHIMKGAGHHLVNESRPERGAILSAISTALTAGNDPVE